MDNDGDDDYYSNEVQTAGWHDFPVNHDGDEDGNDDIDFVDDHDDGCDAGEQTTG